MEVTESVQQTVVPSATVYRNRQKSSLIMIEMQKQREKGTFCDVLLEAGGLQYWAHSCVLAAHSKKLGSAVENGKAKFGAKGVIKMKLPTSNSLLVESLIKYMYDAHLSITSENVEDLIQLAAKLEMDDIKQCCAVHLCRTMTSNNWAYVKRTGERYKLEDAIKGIQEYCSKNFCDIVHDFDFLNLDLNLLELIIKAGNEYNVPRVELHLLYGILKWVSHDLDQRKEHFEQLISILNPKLLTTDKCLALFEEETIKNSNLINDEVTKDLLQRVTEAFEERMEGRPVKRTAEDGAMNDDEDYQPDRKRNVKRLMPESEYPRTDDGKFVCPHCCKTFEKTTSLVGHFKVHNAHWLCDMCGYTTDTYYQRLVHVQEKHDGIKDAKFVCQITDCDYESTDHEDMRKHIEAHGKSAKGGGPHKCDVCGVIFGTKLLLHNHRSTDHKDAIFKCQNCTFEAHTQSDFESHLKQEHPDVAVILGYMSQGEAKSNKSKAVGDAMKSSDIYKKSSTARTIKECPFCKAFCTFKNDRLVSHIKKSHADVTVQQMQEELKKILSKNSD